MRKITKVFAAGAAVSETSLQTVQRSSGSPETVAEAIRQRYETPTSKIRPMSTAAPSAGPYGHRQATQETLQRIGVMEKFMRSKYDQIDIEDRVVIQGKIESAFGTCRESVQAIANTDNFFELSSNFCDLDDARSALSQTWAEELGLSVKRETEEGKAFKSHVTQFLGSQLKLSRQALETVHQGKVAAGVLEKEYESRYFWQGGSRVLSMLIGAHTKL